MRPGDVVQFVDTDGGWKQGRLIDVDSNQIALVLDSFNRYKVHFVRCDKLSRIPLRSEYEK